MPNIKAELIRNFHEEIEWIDKQIGATRLANAERFIKENTMPLSEVTGLPRTVIAPSPIGMNTSAHITILSTHIMELALDLCDEIVILNDGVLRQVSREELDDEDFKNRIIAALKGESDV